MDQNNSSSPSDPFDESLLLFDDELLQELLNGLPPISTHQHDNNNLDVYQPLAAAAPAGGGGGDGGGGGGGGDNGTTRPAEAGPPQLDHQNVGGGGGTVNKGKGNSKGKRNRKGKDKDNSKAIDVERRRRQEMAALHRSLRSQLPAEYVRGKRSISDHLHEAVKYIKDLEGGLKELGAKKNDLLMMRPSSSAGSCNFNSNYTTTNNNTISNNNSNYYYYGSISNQEYVTVNPSSKEGCVEIIVRGTNQGRPSLSKVLHVLSKEGLSVVNCVSSRVGNNLIHSIQAQVDDGRNIDIGQLQYRLTCEL